VGSIAEAEAEEAADAVTAGGTAAYVDFDGFDAPHFDALPRAPYCDEPADGAYELEMSLRPRRPPREEMPAFAACCLATGWRDACAGGAFAAVLPNVDPQRCLVKAEQTDRGRRGRARVSDVCAWSAGERVGAVQRGGGGREQ